MKKAVLLLNMGGPNNLSEVKTFLTNMFNDHRIIAAPKPIRTMIAWFITTSRHKEAEHNYALIGGKSPIVGYTKGVVDALSQQIDADVHYVMRYTPPFTDEVLTPLKDHPFVSPFFLHYDPFIV